MMRNNTQFQHHHDNAPGPSVAMLPMPSFVPAKSTLRHPSQTVAAVMTNPLAAFRADLLVDNAVDHLRDLGESSDQPYYVYVVDKHERLVGVLSLRDIVLAQSSSRLGSLIRSKVVSVAPTMTRLAAMRLMQKHRFAALPVVDNDGRLIGSVGMDDVTSALDDEATQETQKLFGAGPEERVDSSWAYSYSRRLPWLLINLALACLGAVVISRFESTIAAVAVLAVYLPVIGGMGGNATAQAMAVAIRDIARGRIASIRVSRIVVRELKIGALMGAIIGLIAGFVAWCIDPQHGVGLGLIVAAAITINLAIGCLWGVSVPLIMRRLGFDPAQSATIFTTTITDMAGFYVLLSLGHWWLGGL